tara:strand:+ start:454 stop:918 length:465 start_codon:yes stop_codon:yes gene_type:complete
MKTHAIDRGGIFVSLSCLIHCALCAFFPAMWSILGTSTELGELLEWGLTLLACAIAALTLWFGWRRLRSMRIAALFAAGIVLLLGARMIEHFQDDAHHVETSHVQPHHEEGAHEHDEDAAHGVIMLMAVLAALFLVSGHLASLRASRCCPPVSR